MIARLDESCTLQPAFVVTFVAVAAGSVAMALWVPVRELSTIALFIPLLWSFMVLCRRGMLVAGLVLAGVRVAVEAISLVSQSPDVPPPIGRIARRKRSALSSWPMYSSIIAAASSS